MLSKKESQEALRKLFQQNLVVDIKTLYKILETNSRMSVFRRLREAEYISSYTHGGRYYTLADIPQYDSNGLWFFQGKGFSQFGTLKATLAEMVNTSVLGMTHSQLHHLLGVKVQDALLGLVRVKQIGRKEINGMYLYVSADLGRAREQISYQQQARTKSTLPMAKVIAVLVETIRGFCKVSISMPVIAEHLAARGLRITVAQVEQVFTQYGIDTQKKTPE